MKPRIPDSEFRKRVLNTQEVMRQKGLDLLLCYGNEAEPQFVRYYSDYWPSFESAGVLIPAEGEPILIIGPESETFASHVSRIKNIRKILVFRESSDPEYPGAKLDTFETVINEAMNGKSFSKFGIAGASLITQVIYAELKNYLDTVSNVEIIKADDLVSKLRMIKTDNEIACMKEAYDITQYAMMKVIESIRAGMTENQVKGIALSAIFEKGGEGESYPFWVLTGKNSNQAISRCRNKVIQDGDIVQVQAGARYEGYASTIGRPIVIGKATQKQKDLIKAGLAAQNAILEVAKPGVNAKKISEVHYNTLKKLGFDDHILYGPCHGTGLMEGEYPWIESTSDYLLKPNMTFCTCIYLGNDKDEIGIRIEDGFCITDDGAELFTDYRREVIEV